MFLMNCSFCGNVDAGFNPETEKIDKEKSNLIIGPEVSICHDCVAQCLEIILQQRIVKDNE